MRKFNKAILFFAAILISNMCMLRAQTTTLSHAWERTEITDSFSGETFSRFVLEGRFLDQPESTKVTAPRLIVDCKATGEKSMGYHIFTTGKMLKAHLNTGAVINRVPSGTPAMYRIDDHGPKKALWSISTDGTAAFFDIDTLRDFVWGHDRPHKENTGPPTKKVLIELDEAFAGRIVIEFDPLESTALDEVCGLTWKKRQ